MKIYKQIRKKSSNKITRLFNIFLHIFRNITVKHKYVCYHSPKCSMKIYFNFYLNQQKHLFLPIIAYSLSSTTLEIRAK
jgi:hypothetical protein